MRFLVNPECYHKMCESCVDRIFSTGPGPCPIAGCARTLRKARFRKQTFEDLRIEREVDVRRRVAEVMNRRQEEFLTLRDFNNYLEEVEDMTFNLVNGVDVQATEQKLRAYERENVASIHKNAVLNTADKAKVEAGLRAQKERSRLAREMSRQEEAEEKRAKEEGRREILDKLAHSKGNADKIIEEGQRVMLKKSSARGEKLRREHQQQQQLLSNEPLSDSFTDAFDTKFKIAGLKPIEEPEPEKPFDPFGGVEFTREYYAPQKGYYEHPFSQKAKTDTNYTAGGYNVMEYQARAMFEAFSGLGVFVGEEKA